MKKIISSFFCVFFLASVCQADRSTGVTDSKTWITVDSITWTMDDIYTVGQYITTDYYVVCPTGCSITAIAPTQSSTTGTMKNPRQTSSQGYNTNARNYSAGDNAGLNLPISLVSGDVIVSTTPRWSTTEDQTWIDEAAILTVVASAPAANTFRPGYSNTSINNAWTESDLDYTVLGDLTPTASAPAPGAYDDKMARPWIDHMYGWTGRSVHPFNNMQDFGAQIAQDVALVALYLQLDYTDSQKRSALIGMVQWGIDLYSIISTSTRNPVTEGVGFGANGGHMLGRKLPILIAGKVLGDADLLGIGARSGDYRGGTLPGTFYADYIQFQEDEGTAYITQGHINSTTGEYWDPDTRNPNSPQPYTAEMLGMPEWGISVYATRWDASWTAMYRQGTNGQKYSGIALTAHIMGLKETWNHDAFFDYVDRYVAISNGSVDPFGYTVPHEEATWPHSGFEKEMWDTYRELQTPTPPSALLTFDQPGQVTFDQPTGTVNFNQ